MASVSEERNSGTSRQNSKAGFPRSLRLLKHADFERVYKQGRRHFSPSMTIFYCQRKIAVEISPVLRIGFTVGRALGGAVQRNRMKRRLREAVRMAHPATMALAASVDVVINPKKSVLTADYDTLLNEVRQAFVVIEKKFSGKKPEA
jgi:ribonuclease P protein component